MNPLTVKQKVHRSWDCPTLPKKEGCCKGGPWLAYGNLDLGKVPFS